jgi:F-type H+-transporting ATPase subunit epsilon
MTMAALKCIVVTPEKTVLDRETEFVALPLFDGEIGIAPSHSPLIGRLGFGEMRLVAEAGVERYYLEGGFVEVLDDVVSVLTPRALRANELDEAAAAEQIRAAQSRLARSPELIAARDRTIAMLRAQIRVARRARG